MWELSELGNAHRNEAVSREGADSKRQGRREKCKRWIARTEEARGTRSTLLPLSVGSNETSQSQRGPAHPFWASPSVANIGGVWLTNTHRRYKSWKAFTTISLFFLFSYVCPNSSDLFPPTRSCVLCHRLHLSHLHSLPDCLSDLQCRIKSLESHHSLRSFTMQSRCMTRTHPRGHARTRTHTHTRG